LENERRLPREHQMDREPYPKDQQQPPQPEKWDPEEEGRQEQAAYQKHRQRQRGGPVNESR